MRSPSSRPWSGGQWQFERVREEGALRERTTLHLVHNSERIEGIGSTAENGLESVTFFYWFWLESLQCRGWFGWVVFWWFLVLGLSRCSGGWNCYAFLELLAAGIDFHFWVILGVMVVNYSVLVKQPKTFWHHFRVSAKTVEN